MRPSHISSFGEGMWSDFDVQKTGDKTYLHSEGGRVIFNEDGTLAWENAKGNKLVISLGFNYGSDTNYFIIGAAEIDNKLILLSTQNTVTSSGLFSEIGVLTEQQVGVYAYKTVFNDQYDPYGNLMRLSTRYQAKAKAIFENKDIVRIYWCDDNNEDRVFNVVSGSSFNYAAPYPGWYSVHGMSEMCDVQWGLIKYRRNVTGGLTAGKREYFYRLVHKSGYATPFSPGGGLVFLTADLINTTDWNQYEMSSSGTQTNKGHELEIKYIDQRFQKIEVACALYETDTAPIRADIIFQGDITGTSMIITHDVNNGVVPIPDPTVLAQRFTDVIHSKTKAINENYQHKGNVVLRKNLSLADDKIEAILIEPYLRRMLSDELGYLDYLNDVTPLTHQVPKTSDVDVQLFQGWLENYLIGDDVGGSQTDYINYKGTQWEHLFKGYFRKQTYPFAIVLWDRKGQPCFAQHIGDFTFPAQYDNNWTLQRLSGTTTGGTGNIGDYQLTIDQPGSTWQITNTIQQGNIIALNILGLKISNIDLSDVVFDDNGEIQLSGFSIVRADRVQDLIAQGLILNTITQDYTDLVNRVLPLNLYPLYSTGNKYFTGVNGNRDHGNIIIGINQITGQPIPQDGHIGFNYFTLELPDYIIDQSLINEENKNFLIELQGSCSMSFITDDPSTGNFSLPVQLNGTQGHFFTKNYNTSMGIWRSDQSSSTFGVDTRVFGGNFGAQYHINKLWADVFDNERQADSFTIKNDEIKLWNFFPPLNHVHGVNNDANTNFAQGHQHSIFIKSDYVNASAVTPYPGLYLTENRITYYIVNIISNQSYELTESVVASRIYKNIGHFIPINADVLAAATDSGFAIFNDIEVWGGDCFVDFFGYARLLPNFQGCDIYSGSAKSEADYSMGLIFPCETAYNHTMRKGVTYPKVATKPESTQCDDNTGVFYDGIYVDSQDLANRRVEDFNVNRVLQATGKTNTFKAKSVYFVEENDLPLNLFVSKPKFAGETFDSFRIYLVNDTAAVSVANSDLGAITDIETLGYNLYVLQQKGFGRVRFNERTLLSTSTDNLTVGTGAGYQGFDYIEKNHGCQHQFSVVNNGRSFYWIDAWKGKHCRFGQDGFSIISDLYGQHNYFTAETKPYWIIQDPVGIINDQNEDNYDNPCGVGGIAGVFDYNNNSAYWTFTKRLIAEENYDIVEVGTPDTIEYSEAQNQYKDHPPFAPRIYLNLKQNFLSPDPDNPFKIYVHNEGVRGEFYGVLHDSRLKFSVNPFTQIEKVFDNNKLNINPEAFALLKTLTMTTENGTQILNFATDDRAIYREGYGIFPLMQISQEERMRGKYLILDFVFKNQNDVLIRASQNEVLFRKSYR